jgi:hypothetical protein
MQKLSTAGEGSLTLMLITVPAIYALISRAALADDNSATTPATTVAPTAPASKWQFTLLNPVPADQLRGMDTDRPNVTNTPHTVDAGHVQMETGLIDYSYDRSRFSGGEIRSDDFAFAPSNFRLGLLDDLEVNAAIDPYQIDRTHESTSGTNAGSTFYSRGLGDTVVGAKLNLWGNEGGDATWVSGLAIQPQFKFPTASHGLGNGHFEFSVALPFLLNLPAAFHLGLQSGVSLERNTANDGNLAGMQNSISVDRVVWKQLDVYVEYASDVTSEKHVDSVQTVDIGGTFPLNDNVVLDTGFDLGLNRATSDLQVLAGISVRF